MKISINELRSLEEIWYKKGRADKQSDMNIDTIINDKDNCIEYYARQIQDKDITIKYLQHQIENTTLTQPQRAVPKMPKAPEAIDDDIPF